MDNLFTYSLTVLTGFFAVMNPLANTPVFAGLTKGSDKETTARIARTSCFVAFLIVIGFAILGKYIFELFGITIPSFKIAGGVLLFFVGFRMLQSKKSGVHHPDDVQIDDGVAISPLAIPILAGPGTIVAAMNNVAGGDLIHVGIVTVAFALMCLLTWLAFSLSDVIMRKLGENLIMVVEKIMGLILTIMGTAMTVEGVKMVFSS